MTKRAYNSILALMSIALFPYAIVTYNNMGEDAFISFRYVRNFVEGRGLVFNAGEWVEGYSNFSWVMALSLPAKLGGDILLWSKLLSVAAMAGMIWLAGLYFVNGSSSDHDEERKVINPIFLFAPLAIFFNPHLHYHVGRGLETNFYALVFLACLFALSRAKWLTASICFALLAMSRPEGLLHFAGFACIITAFVLFSPRILKNYENSVLLNWRSVAWFVIPGLLILCIFVGWRWATYEQLFPNTVYAKTAPLNFVQNPSSKVLLSFMQAWSGLPLLSAVAIVFLWQGIGHRWHVAVAATGALAILVYVVMVGAVQSELFRHFIPMIAPIILMLQAALISAASSRNRLLRKMVWPAFALLLIMNFYTENNGDHPASRLHERTAQFLTKWDWQARWEWYRHPPIHMFSEAGRWAEENLPPGSVIAGDQMGQMGYYAASHTIIDMLGLMDRHIAHNGLSWDYISRRDPDYFIVYGEGDAPFLLNIRAFTDLPEFKQSYAVIAILESRYPEKISNQFIVYGRLGETQNDHPAVRESIGATAKEWETYWRFQH